ncbi:MAG: regulatory protein RecX, partial [Pseudomonadota bacterium]
TEPRDPAEARVVAMNALARREHSASELEQKLARAGFAGEVAAATVATLAGEGLQSDARFAESLIASYARRGKGPLRAVHDLGQRGVEAGLIDAALAAAAIDWHERARDARTRKFGATPPEDFSDKAKQMRFLRYRGFSSEQIAAALAETP